jgi:outer membrane protein assembly factor BamB
MDRELSRAADRLSAFWNAVVRDGSPPPGAADVDPELDVTLAALTETVRQIAARDDAPPPAPGLAERTWAQLMRWHGFDGAVEPLSTSVGQLNGYKASLPPPRVHRRQEPRPRWSRLSWATGQFATAIMLVLTLIGAYFVFVGERRQPASFPAVEEPATPGDVPMDRGDSGRSGVMPGPGPAGTPTERWRFNVGQGVVLAPVVVDGVAYVGRGFDFLGASNQPGALFAVDTSTGEERWEFATLGQVQASPAVIADLVLVADTTGILYAIDIASGAERWRLTIGGFAASPVVAHGVAYVATSSRSGATVAPAVADGVVILAAGATTTGPSETTLWAIDAATGTERWHKDDLPETSGLYAIEATTGGVRWQTSTRAFASGLAVSEQTIYAGTGIDGVLVAIDVQTGVERWHVALHQPFPEQFAPAVADGRVFISVRSSDLIALDAATGTELWRVPGTNTSSSYWIGSPTVVGETIYFPRHPGLVAINAVNGSLIWEMDASLRVYSYPVVADGLLFLGNLLYEHPHSGSLLALADPNGTPLAAVVPPP